MVAEELATFPNEAQFQVINSASSLPTPKNGARRLLIVILEVGAALGVRGHFKIQLLFIAWRVACLWIVKSHHKLGTFRVLVDPCNKTW